jgi:cephalosporin hydroxylase
VRLRSLLPESIKQKYRRRIIDEYAKLAYRKEGTWLGIPTQKAPTDLWIYQEMICEVEPDLIIETGTMFGGSALYLASICDLVDSGEVVTIDIEDRGPYRVHPRINYWQGSSIEPAIISRARKRAAGKKVMIILDSDHSASHVREELALYSPLVTEGSYLIVEDTNVNGHPVYPNYGPGPMEALEDFLPGSGFMIDPSREKFLVTNNPRGFLRRTTRTHDLPAVS